MDQQVLARASCMACACQHLPTHVVMHLSLLEEADAKNKVEIQGRPEVAEI
jgi:hypothetical protein